MKIQVLGFGSLSVSAFAQYGTADSDCDTDSDSDSEYPRLQFYFRSRDQEGEDCRQKSRLAGNPVFLNGANPLRE